VRSPGQKSVVVTLEGVVPRKFTSINMIQDSLLYGPRGIVDQDIIGVIMLKPFRVSALGYEVSVLGADKANDVDDMSFRVPTDCPDLRCCDLRIRLKMLVHPQTDSLV